MRALTERETELSLESRNLRESRREIRVAPEALVGLPQDFLDEHPAGDDGLVVLTTDYPDFMPVREYAVDRATRTAIVAAYNDLAWPENDAVLAELLAVRAELAQLLGYGSWADYETETRMIGRGAGTGGGGSAGPGGGAAIADFLARLDEASAAAAAAEYPVLLERLREDDPEASEVTIADFFYLLGALRRERHDVDAQLVRCISLSTGCCRGCSPSRGGCSTSNTCRSMCPPGTPMCARTTSCATASCWAASTSTCTRARESTTTRRASASRPGSPAASFPRRRFCATSRAGS